MYNLILIQEDTVQVQPIVKDMWTSMIGCYMERDHKSCII